MPTRWSTSFVESDPVYEAEKGQPNGAATLDGSGAVPIEQLANSPSFTHAAETVAADDVHHAQEYVASEIAAHAAETSDVHGTGVNITSDNIGEYAASSPDASATVKGISKLSAAPIDPASPIAVGDNDPRVANVEHTTNKAQPGGYASLDGTGNVPAGQLGNAPAPDLSGYVETTDPRLSDERTPTDGSVTDAKVAAGAAIAYSKLALAGMVTVADLAFDPATQAELDTHAAKTAAADDAHGSKTYTDAQVSAEATARAAADALLAPLASPALTGNPTAPTQAQGDNSTRLATTAYVQTETGLLVPKSLVDAKGDLLVGTADNTVARKAVGSNGKGLLSDSTSSDGLRWGNPVRQSLVSAAQGLIAESFPRWAIQGQTPFVSGWAYAIPLGLLKGEPVSNIVLGLAVAGTSITSAFVGLYDKLKNRLALSGDVSAYFTSTGPQVIPLGSTYTVPADDAYIPAVVVSFTGTAPQYYRGANNAAAQVLGPLGSSLVSMAAVNSGAGGVLSDPWAALNFGSLGSPPWIGVS